MSTTKKNFIYNVIYQILIMVLPLATAPYISRVLGADGLGIYSYSYSIVTYFVLFAMLGLNNYGNRKIATIRDDRDKLSEGFWSIYSLQLITSILAIIGYSIYIASFVNSNYNVALVQYLYLFSVFFDINWFYFGIEKFKLTVTRNIVIKLLTFALIFIFVKTEDDLWIYALIMATGILGSQMILWFYLRRYIHFVKPSLKSITSHIKPNLLLFIPVLAVSLYKIMDKIMIGSIGNMTEVGYYANTEKLISLPLGIIAALGTVMLPKMSNMVAKGSANSQLYIRKSMQFVLFMSSGLAFGLSGVSPILAPVFFGREFSVIGQHISVMSLSIIFISWANVIRTQYLIPNNKDRLYVTSVIIGAVINFCLNLILIETYGAYGAVIATLSTEVCVALYQSYVVRKQLNLWFYLKEGYIYLVFGLIMFFIVRMIGKLMAQSITTLIVQIIVGASVYIFISAIYYSRQKCKKNLQLIN